MFNRGRKITDFFGAPAKASASSKPKLLDRDRTDSPTTRVWPSPRPQSRHGDSEMREASDSPIPVETTTALLTDERLARKLQDDWNKESQAVAAQAPKSVDNRATSGGSFSSLNSTGSKRVYRHGQEVVGNSDSDTDSSEGLEDLDSLLRNKPSPAKPLAVSPNTHLPTRAAKSSLNTRQQKPVIPPAKRYKVSLSSLVEESKREAALKEKYAAAEAKLAQTDIESARSENVEKMLATIVDDEEGGTTAGRLLLAMKRTNVLQRDPAWQFFRENVETQRRRNFPKSFLPHKGWTAIFKDPNKRDQAFIAGYARQVFRYQDLPEELAAWMIDELAFFPRDEVNAEYIHTLEGRPEVVSSLLAPEKLYDILHRLGAKDVAKDPTIVLAPSFYPPNHSKQAIPTGLKWIVQLLRHVALDLASDSRVQALNVLLRLSFDDSIVHNVALHNTIQDGIKDMIHTIPEPELSQTLHLIIDNLTIAVETPILQAQLVSALPITSPLTHRFQRRLALAFFLHPKPCTESLASPTLPAIVHDYLATSPHFQIGPNFSYSGLGARMTLLDKAIGPGFSDLTFLAPTIPSPGSSNNPTPNTNANTPTPPSPEEKAFNESVDLLVSRIKWISNRIDAGSQGMDRCEAKSVCQRLHYRLEGAVRTRGVRIRGVFGSEEEDEGRRVFKRWLVKDGKTTAVN